MTKLTYAVVKPGTLKASPTNPRRITPKARARLKRGLQEFGVVDPIIVRRRDRRVLGGHQRLDLALELKLPTVPTIQVDGLSDAQADALTVLLNNPGAQGTWDTKRLAELLDGLAESKFDVTLTGFDPADLERMSRWRPDEQAPDPTARAAAGAPKSKRGEVWQLGPHRLMCGDATDAGDVKRLMDGQLARLVVTDPPYGVQYSSDTLGGIAGDDKSGDTLILLLKGAFTNAAQVTEADAAFYIWHAGSTRRDFEFAMRAAGLEERQYLVWVKDSFVLGNADYQWQAELCFYAQKAGQRARWFGDRTQGTTWRLERPELAPGPRAVLVDPAIEVTNGAGSRLWIGARPPKGKKIRAYRLEPGEVLQAVAGDAATDAWLVSSDPKPYAHPTQKPSELAARAMRNSSEPGDIVLDLFGGGGFTLLGAERTGRRAYVMELEPKYCDVIRTRWAEATGAAPSYDSPAAPVKKKRQPAKRSGQP